MQLVFIHGMPGVGKLTVARELATLTGFKLFHNHLTVDLVESLFEFGSKPFVELREEIWLATFSKAAEAKLAGLIFTFAFDRTVRQTFIEAVREIIETNDGEAVFVELRCSAEELQRRISDPTRRSFGKLNSVELFRELNAGGAFVDPGIPAERLVLDTTNVSAAQGAALIASRLGFT